MKLFERISLGRTELANRVVMAPMTRSRATGNVANDLHVAFYQARASAGLLITEGTSPSPNGLGYPRIPGIYSPEQVRAWRSVTDAVHAAGGHVFVQVMHTGRITHSLNLPQGGRILAPSSVTAQGVMYTDQSGPQPFGTPIEMTADDIAQARREFAHAARNAHEAGFDGLELHAANGYLLEQFLQPHTNRRSDVYGGSPESRTRFVVEVAEAAAAAIGADRVAIRISPFNTFNDMPLGDAGDVRATYTLLARQLKGLAYVHLIQNASPSYPALEGEIRSAFSGPLMLNGGFDAESAERALESGRAELISFGRPFISHPDWVRRLQLGQPAVAPDPATFYTPGPEGYVDIVSVPLPPPAQIEPTAAV